MNFKNCGNFIEVNGVALVRKTWARGTLRAVVEGGRIVFKGGASEHSIAAEAHVSPAERILAHWEGYCENNGVGLGEGAVVSFYASGLLRTVKVLSKPRPGSKTVMVSGFTYKHGGKAKPRRVEVGVLRVVRGAI